MKKLIYALRFMTILPIPWKENEDLVKVSRSSGVFPLVGFIIGFLLAATGLLFRHLLPLPVIAVTQTLLWIFLTGGLHLDGLSDTFDGIGSRQGREKTLEIMKDSNIGAFGALALISQILFKYILISEINKIAFWLIIIPPVTGRWGQLISIYYYNSARDSGMGKFFRDYIRKYELILGLLITVAVYCLLLPLSGLLILPIHALLIVVISSGVSRKLGGLTGDVYGLICETGESATLLLLLLYYSIIGSPVYSEVLNQLIHLFLQ